ncbi:MAG: glutamyl-tRNA reductase [Candidatus Omnitrophica bacterium]|nr:glutamyl-tRNA reductase [Candidatus Omnitrophota bacterium]
MPISNNLNIVLIGTNHKKAPLEIREKFSFEDKSLSKYYRELSSNLDIEEALMLSTCNRVEIYAVGESISKITAKLTNFICRTHKLPQSYIEHYFYNKTNEEAVIHLNRVASGLDSMVLGENQILGQIKKAYEKADSSKAIGSILHKTIQDSLRIGKKVRSLTGISRGVTSISGVVVDLIKKEQDLSNKRILVIGAGKIGVMTTKKLSELPLKEIVVTNRDIAKAKNAAVKLNVRVTDFSKIAKEIALSDIVVAATAAPHIISKDMVSAILHGRHKRIIFVDLGVPRNVEEAVRNIAGVKLYNIDDLSPVIDRTLYSRSIEANKAEEIIRREMYLDQKKNTGVLPSLLLCAE